MAEHGCLLQDMSLGVQKVRQHLVEPVRLLPEEHVPRILEKDRLRPWNGLAHIGAPLPGKDLAVPGDEHERGDRYPRQEVSPVDVRMVTHDLDAHLGRTLGYLVRKRGNLIDGRLPMKAAVNKPFGRGTRQKLRGAAGTHKRLRVIATCLAPGPVRTDILRRRLINTDELPDVTRSEQFKITPGDGCPHGPPDEGHLIQVQRLNQIEDVHRVAGNAVSVQHLLGFPMTAEIHKDDFMVLRQGFHVFAEKMRRAGPAWKEQHRFPLTVYFVVNGNVIVGGCERHD